MKFSYLSFLRKSNIATSQALTQVATSSVGSHDCSLAFEDMCMRNAHPDIPSVQPDAPNYKKQGT